MRITSDISEFAMSGGPFAIAAGFFDGVHAGHRRVLARTIEVSRRIGGEAWALTFEPHPLAVLDPDKRPEVITPLEFRLERLSAAGIDGCLLLPFTKELAAVPAADFAEKILEAGGKSKNVVLAGENWRFGAGGAGSIRTLPTLSKGRVMAELVPPVIDRGDIVSSTRIRVAIKVGDLQTATRLLGRPYRLRAKVIHGRGVGHTMGVATANLLSDNEVLPPVGVYAVWAGTGAGRFRAVCNIGYHPTFPNSSSEKPDIEVHLLGFSGDIYDTKMDVAFIDRLRDEIKFSEPNDLVRQIRLDIEAARDILSEPSSEMFPPPLAV